ncbi:MAG: GAF domain-containing protein [Gammaproteobacteria bacterium]
MPRRHALLMLISAFVVVCVAANCWFTFNEHGLPFTVAVVSARTAVISPTSGLALPAGVQAGDRIDLSALDHSARIAISITNLQGGLPQGRTYQLVVQRGTRSVVIPVTTVDWGTSSSIRFSQWGYSVYYVLLGVLALLALWRGRDRASRYIAIWLIMWLPGLAMEYAPLDGFVGIGMQIGAILFFLLTRIGFYLLIESMVKNVLTSRTLAFVRAVFVLAFTAGAVMEIGEPLLYVLNGWAGLLLPLSGIIFTACYMVPALLLLLSYAPAGAAQRLRIRWLLLSTLLLMVSIFFSNSTLLDVAASNAVQSAFFILSMSGFVYTVLRHRVIDVSFVISRALVYTVTTSIVVGIFAAMNGVVEHATLGQGANLALELLVPLLLGIGFNTLRIRIDGYISRFFFRRRYRAETALNEFAQSSAFIKEPGNLLDLAIEQVFRHSGSQGVALYEDNDKGFARSRHKGKQEFQEQVATDDLALVRLRAGEWEVDLHDLGSTLGQDGYVFPMSVRGTVIGALVCGPRPGEAYTADERKLLAHVAHQVGVALHALRVQETMKKMESKAKLVDALASGSWPSVTEIQAKARELVSTAILV